jgi:SAM-dependent methyltransferase
MAFFEEIDENLIKNPPFSNLDRVIKSPNLKPISFEESNSISREKLNDIANRVLDLREPNSFGKFQTNGDYLKTLDILLESTFETSNRYCFFQKIIIPKIRNFFEMLDIGPGTGALTQMIGEKFNYVTAVDSNIEPLLSLKKNFPNPTKLKIIHQSIIDVNVPRNKFDLAILSHVLYYIPVNKWTCIIDKLLNSLVPSGVLVVILNGGMGKAKLIKHFGGTPRNIDHLLPDLTEKSGVNVEMYVSKEIFYSLGLEPLLHISGIHLLDAGISASREDLTSYLEKNSTKVNGIYELDVNQKFLILQKK